MAGKQSLLFVLAALAATAPFHAFAQSPFAGTWAGTFTNNSNSSCTSTSSSGTTVTPGTCSTSAPWSGTVDGAGNFALLIGAGTITCNGSSTPYPADTTPSVAGMIDSKGNITFAPDSSNFTTPTGSGSTQCSGSSFHFSGSAMSGSISCTDTSHDVLPGTNPTTIDCTGADTTSYSGTMGSGSVLLTPPKVVFPMTVNKTITTTSASATAQVSPPSTQVGTTASVYVFAHARLSSIPSAKREAAPPRKDGASPDPCVLAQVNANGQLTGTSASSMQAYTTGVLSSQMQAVTVLNNVPTSNVAGASMIVGYGTSASAMLASGNYQGAVSVDGSSPCSAALLASAAPLSPGPLSGLWWNPNESGWGIGFVQRRNVVFGAWYTYDGAGKDKWYVASNCNLPEGNTGTNGTCTGTLYQVSGPTFFGAAFNPALRNVATVGSLSVAFQDANNAMMTYTVNGQSRTIPIIREIFWSGTTPPAVDYTDLWWNPNESGWGMVVTQQYGVMFLAWYVYDAGGNPTWFVAPDCVMAGSGCSGTVYNTTGPPLGPTFDSTTVHAAAVGNITATFLDANNASITYTVNGTTATKAITRETF